MAKTPTDIRSLARSHSARAVNVLVGIMREKKAPHAARVSAAIALLDRGWGKPAQSMDVTVTRRAQELTDAELSNIATGSGEGIATSPDDSPQLH